MAFSLRRIWNNHWCIDHGNSSSFFKTWKLGSAKLLAVWFEDDDLQGDRERTLTVHLLRRAFQYSHMAWNYYREPGPRTRWQWPRK